MCGVEGVSVGGVVPVEGVSVGGGAPVDVVGVVASDVLLSEKQGIIMVKNGPHKNWLFPWNCFLITKNILELKILLQNTPSETFGPPPRDEIM